MPNVVVGALLGGVERDRQQRLGPVQRLDLRLLVHTEDDRPGRWVEVEPDNVGHLVRERRVLADLEGTLLVRLQPGLPPQLCHIVVRHVHTLGALDERSHLPTRPMRQASLGG